MAYIGNIPADKYQTLQKQSFTTSATDTYILDYAVTNPQDLALFINNVRQNPNDAYTVSGTTLTLSSAITGSDTMYAVFLGRAVETVAPALSSVTNDMLAGSIANAKLANSSITLNGSAVSLGGSATIEGITMADQWRLSADFSLPTGNSDITSNIERADTRGAGQIGSAMTVSSGKFTFPSTGFYLVTLQAQFYTSSGDGNLSALIRYSSDNGSNYDTTALIQQSANPSYSISFGSGAVSVLLDITDTSNQVVIFRAGSGPSGTPAVLRGDTDQNETTFTFIRLGDT
jgi:hypothetical protein